METKWTEHPDPSDAATIVTLDRELASSGSPWRPGPHYVVSRTAATYPIAEGIEAVDEDSIAAILGIER